MKRRPRQTKSSRRCSYKTFDEQNGNPSDIQSIISMEHVQNMPYVQMIVFGIGACLWLIFNLIKETNSFEDITKSYGDFVSTLDEIIYLFSIIIQMVFLAKYAGAILPNSALFHYSIALMIADKVWVWLTVTLGDLIDVATHHHIKIPIITIHIVDNFTSPSTPLNSSTETIYKEVLDGFLIFLEPFFIEFLTISIGVLFNLWHLIGSNRVQQQLHRLEEDQTTETTVRSNELSQDYSYLADENLCNSIQVTSSVPNYLPESEGHTLMFTKRRSNAIQSKKEKLMMGMYLIFIGIVTLGALCTGLMWNYGTFHKLVQGILSDETQYYLFRSVQIIAYFPVSVAVVVAMYNTYQENPCWSVSFTSSDYLLFFTAAANFIWYLLKLIAEATVLDVRSNELHREEVEFALIFSVQCILQVWVQTQFLLAAQSVRRLGRQNSKLTRLCLMYLAAINIALWLQMAISRETIVHDPHSIIPVLSDCFGEVTTRTLIFLFYPAMELYRFHSAVIAYEILA